MHLIPMDDPSDPNFLPPSTSNGETLYVIQSKDDLNQIDYEIMVKPRKKESTNLELLLSRILRKLEQSDNVEDKILKTVTDNTTLLRTQTRLLQDASDEKFLPPRKRILIEGPVKSFESPLDQENLAIMAPTINKAHNKILSKLMSSNNFSPNFLFRSSTKDALLTTLHYLCDNTTLACLSNQLNTSISTCKKCISFGIDLIMSLESEILKWPSESQVIKSHFAEISNFPDILGIIGSTHIPVRPSNNIQSIYLLAVCDATMRFTFASTANSGCYGREGAFTNSDLWTKISTEPEQLFPHERFHLIGDSSFPLHTHIMVPYPFAKRLSESQLKFNQCLAEAQKTIGSAFQGLRKNFKRLEFIDAEIEDCSKVILSCCIVHNLLISPMKEIIISEDVQNSLNYLENFFTFSNTAILKREKICNHLAKM